MPSTVGSKIMIFKEPITYNAAIDKTQCQINDTNMTNIISAEILFDNLL